MEDRTIKRLVDLSHVIEAGMTTFKGLPGPHICDFWTREAAAFPDLGVRFSAGPPNAAGMGTFPVRAYAEIG